jgi:NAD(P)-dependent dehydrogenase (short-subunit alcohol dehydrogenase family)
MTPFALRPGLRVLVTGAAAGIGRVIAEIVSAIWEARWRRAEREIAGFIARRGGRITDEVEREIGRRQLTSNWSARP